MAAKKEQKEMELWAQERGRKRASENNLFLLFYFYAHTIILICYRKSLTSNYVHLLLHQPWEFMGFTWWHLVSYCHANAMILSMHVHYSCKLFLVHFGWWYMVCLVVFFSSYIWYCPILFFYWNLGGLKLNEPFFLDWCLITSIKFWD